MVPATPTARSFGWTTSLPQDLAKTSRASAWVSVRQPSRSSKRAGLIVSFGGTGSLGASGAQAVRNAISTAARTVPIRRNDPVSIGQSVQLGGVQPDRFQRTQLGTRVSISVQFGLRDRVLRAKVQMSTTSSG